MRYTQDKADLSKKIASDKCEKHLYFMVLHLFYLFTFITFKNGYSRNQLNHQLYHCKAEKLLKYHLLTISYKKNGMWKACSVVARKRSVKHCLKWRTNIKTHTQLSSWCFPNLSLVFVYVLVSLYPGHTSS